MRKPNPAPATDEAPWWQRARAEATRARPTNARPLTAWGTGWRALLREAGWLDSLGAGQSVLYVQMVRALDLREGVIEASVVAAKAKPHRVQVRVPAFTDSEWARLARQVVDDGASEQVAISLQAGEVPLGLLDAADRHQLRLLPRKIALLSAACTCGGARVPCGHVVALHLAFAKRLDAEPLLLLKLRGATSETFAALVARVSGEAELIASDGAADVSAGDPFAMPDAPEPDWARLSGEPTLRAPLPALTGWRGRETFDAVVRRLLAEARARLGAETD